MKLWRILKLLPGVLLILASVILAYAWIACRAYVYPNQCLILIRQTGETLPPDQKIAEAGQKGIQREARGPGRYFFLPWLWDWEIVPLTEISAGDPRTWREVYTEGDPDYSVPKTPGAWPEVGIVTSLAGKPWNQPGEVVDEGYQGVQRHVLTPGSYRINTRAYKVEKVSATVVPLGCCGVVTSQLGDIPEMEILQATDIGPGGEPITGRPKAIQKLAEHGQRGVLKDILPPGIYYLNPYVHKVKIVQIGYNQLTQLKTGNQHEDISFPSSDGFSVTVEVTVVWGRHPQHTPQMINRFGEVEQLREIIRQQMRSICRNVGSTYISTDFIQGEKRELYQQKVTQQLQTVCRDRDIELLIALIHNIEVHGGAEQGEGVDLKKTIQRGHIAREEDLTKQAQRETAKVRAELATARVAVEVAREQVVADTRKRVAQTNAEGVKRAEEISAQRDLEVAIIEKQIAELDAQITRVLGKARAEVAMLLNRAEADGKRMMVEALGSGRAYNLLTFAQHFDPENVRLIFAGEGTFWTDLGRLQDAASLELLKSSTTPPPQP